MSEVNSVMTTIQEVIITHQIESESDGVIEFPEEWDEMGDCTIVPLNPSSDKWIKVSKKFRKTLPLTRIVEITCIQSKWLWEKYVFQHKRMHVKNINELELFHGTCTNDPKFIYENEDGFDTHYSNSDMWGQANHFTEKASYSDRYAHRTYDGYGEMFFAKVLTSDSFDCSPDPSLRKPPFKPGGSTEGGLHFAQVQYDTVTGYTNGSHVYMTYDNEKAYTLLILSNTSKNYILLKFKGSTVHNNYLVTLQ